MRGKSLRLRLALAGALSIVAALLLSGVVLVTLFERHAERQLEAELAEDLRQLTGLLAFTPAGAPEVLQPLTNPRFEQPQSGLYWQIEDETTGTLLRSRSLWDFVIALPRTGKDPGVLHRYALPGPNGTTLRVLERLITFEAAAGRRTVRIAAGVDRRDLVAARRGFAGDAAWFLAALAVFLLLASLVQIRIGLKPLDALRREVSEIRSGRKKALGVDEPTEVMPLVLEVNSLLKAQDERIERARAHAADLAHGLKTPLHVLGTDAQRLREKGETAIADEVDELALTMHRRIARQMSRVRLEEGSRTTPAPIALRDAVDRIVGVIARSPRGATLRWTIAVPEAAHVAVRIDDLSELLGAVLENASKWARSEVLISSAGTAAGLRLSIEDDGPGTSPDQLRRLGQRGVRLDQSTEGSGLGLAIATDVVEAYHGSITYALREPQGFRVLIDLPTSAA